MPSDEQNAEALARLFHESYERLAPEHDYETRESSRVEWEDVPEDNRALMIDTAQAVLDAGYTPPSPGAPVTEPTYAVVAREKHGTMLYRNALSCLRTRVLDGYWYDDEDQAEAERIAKSEDEGSAWTFLARRSDHEYEGVEQEAIR